MSRRKKWPPLDERIWDIWNQETFPGGRHPGASESNEIWLDRQRNLVPIWDQLLDLAFADGQWLVTAQTASLIGSSRWWNAIHLGEYERASLEAERCLLHTGPFDRHDSAETSILINVPRLVGPSVDTASKNLEAHIECGVYRPSMMARYICWRILIFDDLADLTCSFPTELRSLARALAVARKLPKKVLAAADQLQSWSEFFGVIRAAAGFEE